MDCWSCFSTQKGITMSRRTLREMTTRDGSAQRTKAGRDQKAASKLWPNEHWLARDFLSDRRRSTGLGQRRTRSAERKPYRELPDGHRRPHFPPKVEPQSELQLANQLVLLVTIPNWQEVGLKFGVFRRPRSRPSVRRLLALRHCCSSCGDRCGNESAISQAGGLAK